jgi:hypothetical protein
VDKILRKKTDKETGQKLVFVSYLHYPVRFFKINIKILITNIFVKKLCYDFLLVAILPLRLPGFKIATHSLMQKFYHNN